MTKLAEYRAALTALPAADWEPYLLAHSNLPGPRGNLELASVVADLGTEAQFRRWASLGPEVAPENTPGCFLAFCGVVGLGAVMARGAGRGEVASPYATLAATLGGRPGGEPRPYDVRDLASDPRSAHPRGGGDGAPALGRRGHGRAAGRDDRLGGRQPVGAARGRRGAVRAAAVDAAGARGRGPAHPGRDHGVDPQVTDRKGDAFKTLRQGLGYCWSVAVAALPGEGKPLMEKWLASPDPDIRWIMRENLKKNRLVRMDAAWVARWRRRWTAPHSDRAERNLSFDRRSGIMRIRCTQSTQGDRPRCKCCS